MRETIELYAIVHGKVQGVCFRAAIQEHANNLGLPGTTRNCDDGTVEVIAQGTQEQLERLLSAIRQAPGYGRVDRIEINYRSICKRLTNFRITA